MPKPDVVVVGGGVIGCAIGWALAREGLAVLLVERDRIAAHASRAAAGMLVPWSEFEDHDPLLEPGLASLELFPRVAAELHELSGIDPELTLCGVLRVAEPAEAPSLRARALRRESHGCAWLTPDEARKREPRLAAGLAGAIWSAREGYVNSLLLTRAFATAAARRGAELRDGVEGLELLRRGERVVGLRTSAGDLECAHVVLAAGAWMRGFETSTGCTLPIEPVRGQMLAIEAPSPPLESIVWGAGVYLVPRRNGTIAVGATVEEAGFAAVNTAEGLHALLGGLAVLMPPLRSAPFVEAWAGLRPATPDRLPAIGPLPGLPGVCVAAGHYRNGVLLAPITASAVADWIVRGRLEPSLRPFDPGRFGRV